MSFHNNEFLLLKAREISANTLCAGVQPQRSPANKCLVAGLVGGTRSLNGDVPVQAYLTEGAAASGAVDDLVSAGCHQLALAYLGEGSRLHGA